MKIKYRYTFVFSDDVLSQAIPSDNNQPKNKAW